MPNDVSYMAKAAGLGAVAEHSNRLTGEGLADQAWYNHAIRRALTWSDRIEQPNHNRREVTLPVIGVGEHLVDRL